MILLNNFFIHFIFAHLHFVEEMNHDDDAYEPIAYGSF